MAWARRRHSGVVPGEEEVRQPSDLSWEPLVRAVLVRPEGKEHRLFVTVHHIISVERP